MAIYSLSQRTSATVAGSASAEIRAAAANKPKIMEVGISQAAATAGVFGLGRPAVAGTTPTTPVTVVDEQDGQGPAGQSQGAIAWSVGPTVPTVFMRRVACPATIGAGVIWTFPRGLGVPAATTVVIWIIATAPVCDIWWVVDE